jgi:hypothetical protein
LLTGSRMAAPLLWSPPLMAAAAVHELSDDVFDPSFVLVLCLLFLVAALTWLGVSLHSQVSQQSKFASAGNRTPTRAAAQARAVPSLGRRIIRLYSTTPGQSRYEYNIGDNQGTRGTQTQEDAAPLRA